MPHLPPTVYVGWGDGVEGLWPAGPSSTVCVAVLYSAPPGAEVHCVRVFVINVVADVGLPTCEWGLTHIRTHTHAHTCTQSHTHTQFLSTSLQLPKD